MEAFKAPSRKGQCLKVCLPCGSRQHCQGTELLLPLFVPQLISSGPSTAETKCWDKSHVPFSACSRETMTQHFKCLYFGFRRLEMQAGEIIQILVRICLKTGLSSKRLRAKASYLRCFLPCKESYRTCTWCGRDASDSNALKLGKR